MLSGPNGPGAGPSRGAADDGATAAAIGGAPGQAGDAGRRQAGTRRAVTAAPSPRGVPARERG